MESINKSLSGVTNFSADGDGKIGENSAASNKLDVMTSKQFNRLTVISVAFVGYTFCHVMFLSSSCNTIWNDPYHVKNADGKEISISSCKPPMIYLIPVIVIDIIGQVILIFFCVAFTIRVIRTKVRKTAEQIWTVVMIVMTAISFNPIYNFVFLHETIIFNFGDPNLQWMKVHKWLLTFVAVEKAISLAVSSVGQLFYFWACSHTFGILDDKTRPSNLRFYGPKILILVIYNLYRNALAVLGIVPSKLPGSTMFALLADFRALQHWNSKVFLQVGILALIEFIIMIAIIRRMCITAKVLREAPYVKNRGKQIGFRYFVMSNIIAYSFFILADYSVLMLVPRGFELASVWEDYDHLSHFKHYLFNSYFGYVPRLLNYVTTAMAAYVNLPADSVGFMGWFKGSDQNEKDEIEPITMKVQRKKLDFNVKRMSSCIVFELLVQLFNFSDVVSMRNASSAKVRELAGTYTNEKGYFLELELFDVENETYVTVFTNADQIIVAFKGTTPSENMKTDLKEKMVKLSMALPSKEYARHELLSSLDWKNAKIHHGFAKSYASVSNELIENLATLYAKKARPLYFTGHSLGGALATIASLDVNLSLYIKDVYVVTFGSPRCGNMFWSRACDQVVRAHWRCALRSDIVTTLPRAGYTHTGKRVALTTSGEMFLDPNAIETLLWSSAGVNASDHGKPAYKKALNLFASKYLPSFKPEFIEQEDELVPE